MTEEQMIEIAANIESHQYMELDPDIWFQICDILLSRAN
jgi:hypothetical protein